MSTAIELIVGGYAKLRDRQSLEDLRAQRRRLAVDLKAVRGIDCHTSIRQIEIDIAAIEAALASLSTENQSEPKVISSLELDGN
jgi:hypothetical protein